MPTQTTTDFTTWDFYNKRVQQELTGGQFVSAESTLVCSGPPELADINGGGADAKGKVYPIGLLESAGIQQSKQLQRIFEIGSSRSYFIPGRVVGSINIGRTFYFGPSLLRVLYAYYRSSADVEIGVNESDQGIRLNDGNVTAAHPQNALLTTFGADELHQIRRSPGPDYFFIDLASDLFSQPTGLAIFFKDQNDNSLGGIYLENCYVQGHQMNISSSSVLIMEGSSLQYDRIEGIQLLDTATPA